MEGNKFHGSADFARCFHPYSNLFKATETVITIQRPLWGSHVTSWLSLPFPPTIALSSTRTPYHGLHMIQIGTLSISITVLLRSLLACSLPEFKFTSKVGPKAVSMQDRPAEDFHFKTNFTPEESTFSIAYRPSLSAPASPW